MTLTMLVSVARRSSRAAQHAGTLALVFALALCCSCSNQRDTREPASAAARSEKDQESPPAESSVSDAPVAASDSHERHRRIGHDHQACIAYGLKRFRELYRTRVPEFRGFADPRVPMLLKAIDQRDHATFERLVGGGVDLSAEGEGGVTAMRWAIVTGNRWAFERLVEFRPDLATEGRFPVAVFLAEFDADWLRLCLKHGVLRDAELKKGSEPTRLVFAAISTGNVASLQLLLETGVDLTVKNPLGNTPLVEAGLVWNWEMVYHLLEAGADPTVKYDANAINRQGISKTRGPDGKMVTVTYPVRLEPFLSIVERERSWKPGKVRRYSVDASGTIAIDTQAAVEQWADLPLGFHNSVDIPGRRYWYAKVVSLLKERGHLKAQEESSGDETLRDKEPTEDN